MTPPDWRSIDRYLTNEASAAERAEVDAWVASDPRNAALLRTLHSQPVATINVDVDAAWTRFQRQRPADVPVSVTPLASRRLTRVLRFAAAAMLVLAAGTFWQIARVGSGRTAALKQPRELVAAAGARSTATLDDGTRVTLNGGSRLTFGDGYGGRSRDVYLDGEGYFEVVHDASRPFRVHARSGVAEDIGTRFTVRAYAAEPLAVAVAEGLVSLRRDSTSNVAAVQLAAGDVGVLSATGQVDVSHGAPLDRYTAWANGSLVLDRMPLRDAVAELDHWYGVRIVIADSALARRPVVARFHGESAQQAIDAIAFALGARAEHNGSTYTLRQAR